MPRQVKCQDTGWLTTSDKAYKAPNNKYYSSQAAYEKIFERNEWRRKCIDELSEVVYGDVKMIIPPMALKLLNDFEDYHAENFRLGYADENMCYWAKDCMTNRI